MYILGMAYTQKKQRKTRGRPAQDQTIVQSITADGERLNNVLVNHLNWSEAEVARLSGVRQSHINDIVNGKRALGREDLRRLGAIGISPEFLLGLTKDFIPPGQTRQRAALESDLAAAVELALARTVPPGKNYRWKVSGDIAFEDAVAAMHPRAKRALTATSDWRGAKRASAALENVLNGMSETDPDIVRLYGVQRFLLSRLPASAPGIGDGLLLVPVEMPVEMPVEVPAEMPVEVPAGTAK